MKQSRKLTILEITAAFLTSILLLFGCTTYDKVETSSITDSLDFEETNRIAVAIPDTSIVDTAFNQDIQDATMKQLIDELEVEGFDYVGELNPDLRISFATYVAAQTGHIDTTRPVVKRVVEEEEVRGPTGDYITTNRKETITTTRDVEPIYVTGPSRVFVLDVVDAGTKTLLWRAFMVADTVRLDEEDLESVISRLVERLGEKI